MGFYNPMAAGGEQPLRVALDRVTYWKGVGAQLSPTVKRLVVDAAKAQAEPTAEASAPSSNGDVKGRRSARELEQQILQLLEAQPTTVKDLADHLKRQQPTVTKALERMRRDLAVPTEFAHRGEVAGDAAVVADEALRLGASKLPIKTRFIQRIAE